MFNRSGLNLAVSLCKPMLATIRHTPPQPPEAPPLVIAHGLYGSARNWGVIARRLATLDRVDHIAVFDHGRLLEHHPRAELAADPTSRYHALLASSLATEGAER